MSKFSYEGYVDIIERVNDKLPIVDFSDVLINKLDKFCIVRHDIEFSVDRALELANVESMFGINSTYTVQLRNNTYNALSEKNIKVC